MLGIHGRTAEIRAAVVPGHLDGILRARRFEKPTVTRLQNLRSQAVLLFRLKIRAQIIHCEPLPREGCRLRRKGLGWPRLLSWHIGFRNCPFLNRPERLACVAIENPHKAYFADLGDDVNQRAVMLNRSQHRRASIVVVPDVVMNHLVIPKQFACACIDSQQAVAV